MSLFHEFFITLIQSKDRTKQGESVKILSIS